MSTARRLKVGFCFSLMQSWLKALRVMISTPFSISAVSVTVMNPSVAMKCAPTVPLSFIWVTRIRFPSRGANLCVFVMMLLLSAAR
jgi:hypothetical protein